MYKIVDNYGKDFIGEVFSSEEQAYTFIVNYIHGLKLVCGDIYVPYKIVRLNNWEEQNNGF